MTDNEANFREVALAMLLWDFNVMDEDSLAKYQTQVAADGEGRLLLSSPN